MFRSRPAMPLLARASAGRACIVSDWCSCHVCQMFVSHVSAMPLHMRASGGRACIVSVFLACLPGMFRSSPAMPLHARASTGRACIVSHWCSCHVCQLRDSNAFAHVSLRWPCVHRIGAPGMFTRHVWVKPSNAFACIVSHWCSCHVCEPRDSNAFAQASPWWPCVHRIGAPGMFTRHVYVKPSNAFACASQCRPRLHRSGYWTSFPAARKESCAKPLWPNAQIDCEMRRLKMNALVETFVGKATCCHHVQCW